MRGLLRFVCEVQKKSISELIPIYSSTFHKRDQRRLGRGPSRWTWGLGGNAYAHSTNCAQNVYAVVDAVSETVRNRGNECLATKRPTIFITHSLHMAEKTRGRVEMQHARGFVTPLALRGLFAQFTMAGSPRYVCSSSIPNECLSEENNA